MVIPRKVLLLALACCVPLMSDLRAQTLDYLQHPMFFHLGDADEGYQNPASPARSDGLTLGLQGASSQGSWSNAILPLPAGTRIAWNRASWYNESLTSISFSTRFGKPDTALGWTAGFSYKWADTEDLRVQDPGITWRTLLADGAELELGAYTFALLGKRESESGGGWYRDDPISLRTEAVVHAFWKSPTRLWEAGGSLEPLTGNGRAPGWYRFAYPVRHIEAGIRPVPWFKLGLKQTETGIREYHFDCSWKFRAAANALRFRVSGLRDYQGYSAFVTKFQISLFGNAGRKKS